MRRGPLYMMLAGAFFTVMVAAAKVAREELLAIEVVFWRACISVPLAFAFARVGGSGLAVRNPRVLAMRSLLGFSAMVCFFTAAKGVTVADLSLIGKLQPIWVALMAPLLLGSAERSGRGLWGVIAGGLLGSALLIGPDLAVGSSYGLYALAATGFSAGAHVLVRLLGRTDAPSTQVFWFQLVTLGLALLAIVVTTGDLPRGPALPLWGPLALCGVGAALGQALMTRAYVLDGAARIAAASYATPLLGVAADALAFGVWPDLLGWVGGALVVGSGLWLLLIPVPGGSVPAGAHPAGAQAGQKGPLERPLDDEEADVGEVGDDQGEPGQAGDRAATPAEARRDEDQHGDPDHRRQVPGHDCRRHRTRREQPRQREHGEQVEQVGPDDVAQGEVRLVPER